MPRAVVLTNRVIWAALLAGQLATVAGLAYLSRVLPLPAHPPLRHPRVLVAIDGTMLALGIATVVVAGVIGFRGATTDVEIRARYSNRMVVAMAALESSSFVGIILAFQSGDFWPLGVVPVLSAAVQLTLFPRRRVAAG